MSNYPRGGYVPRGRGAPPMRGTYNQFNDPPLRGRPAPIHNEPYRNVSSIQHNVPPPPHQRLPSNDMQYNDVPYNQYNAPPPPQRGMSFRGDTRGSTMYRGRGKGDIQRGRGGYSNPVGPISHQSYDYVPPDVARNIAQARTSIPDVRDTIPQHSPNNTTNRPLYNYDNAALSPNRMSPPYRSYSVGEAPPPPPYNQPPQQYPQQRPSIMHNQQPIKQRQLSTPYNSTSPPRRRSPSPPNMGNDTLMRRDSVTHIKSEPVTPPISTHTPTQYNISTQHTRIPNNTAVPSTQSQYKTHSYNNIPTSPQRSPDYIHHVKPESHTFVAPASPIVRTSTPDTAISSTSQQHSEKQESTNESIKLTDTVEATSFSPLLPTTQLSTTIPRQPSIPEPVSIPGRKRRAITFGAGLKTIDRQESVGSVDHSGTDGVKPDTEPATPFAEPAKPEQVVQPLTSPANDTVMSTEHEATPEVPEIQPTKPDATVQLSTDTDKHTDTESMADDDATTINSTESKPDDIFDDEDAYMFTNINTLTKRDILQYIQTLDEKLNVYDNDVDQTQRYIRQEQAELEAQEQAALIEEQRAAELQAQGITREQLLRQRDSNAVDDSGAARTAKQFIDMEQQLHNIVKVNYDKVSKHDIQQQLLYPKLRQYQYMCIQLYGCVYCYEYINSTHCEQCRCNWSTERMNEIITYYKQQSQQQYYLPQRSGMFPYSDLSNQVRKRINLELSIDDRMMDTTVNPTDAIMLQQYPLYIQPSQTLPYLHNNVTHTHQRFYTETILGQRATQSQLIYKQLAVEYKQHMIQYANLTQQTRIRLPDLQDACADIGVSVDLVLSQTPLSMIPIEQVRQVRIMRSQAVIPDMIIDKRHDRVFNNNNGYIEDVKQYERLHKQQHIWSETEKSIFVRQYLKSPKQFKKISQHLPNKSINDCVAFYYLTKFDVKYKQLLKQKQLNRINKTQAMLSNQPTTIHNDVMQTLSIDDILDDEQRQEAYTKIQQQQQNMMYNNNTVAPVESGSDSDEAEAEFDTSISSERNNSGNKQQSQQRIPRELMNLAVDISNMERRNSTKNDDDTESDSSSSSSSTDNEDVVQRTKQANKPPGITRGRLMTANNRMRGSQRQSITTQQCSKKRTQSFDSKIQSGTDHSAEASSSSSSSDSETDDHSTQQNNVQRTVRAEWSQTEKQRMLDGLAMYGKNFTKLSDYIGSKDTDKVKIWYMNNRRRINVIQQLAEYDKIQTKK